MASKSVTESAGRVLIRKYFEENMAVQSNIISFNDFVDRRIKNIVEESKEAIPAVIPPEVEEVKFVFSNVQVKQPIIIEADGAERRLLPSEARLRSLNYAAPITMEISLELDGKERDRAEVQIAELPIMLRSKLCRLHGMNREELIAAGEDPDDPGGYFIINGTERVLVSLEDLAPNNIFVKSNPSPITHSARLFSASKSYKIPHTVERTNEGIFNLNFASLTKAPVIIVLKALGIANDKDIIDVIGLKGTDDDLYLNLLEFVEIKKCVEAQEFLAKMLHGGTNKEQRIQRIEHMLDNLLFPHIGIAKKDRLAKAYLLGRMIKKILLFKNGKIREDDRDHYMNKRVRIAGDLLEDLFRANFKNLVSDILYIFQRGVRRGRLTPINALVRTKYLTQRIRSAMATGNWTASRQGVSQRLDRENLAATLSHLGRVVSLLDTSRESFKAREVHPTYWGRICPLESPEGKNIGLRKNFALLASVTATVVAKDRDKVLKALTDAGLTKLGETLSKSTDVFLDGQLIGTVEDGAQFAERIRDYRRSGRVTNFLNLRFNEDEDSVHMALDRNRVRRPLIVVKNGKSLLTEQQISDLIKGSLTWSDLIKKGVIEELDALEEDNALVALYEKDITKDHTHLELHPLTIFSPNTSLVPYAPLNQSVRTNKGQSLQKQGAGIFAKNFINRLDTNVNILHYPQRPIVKSFTQDTVGEDKVGGQNLVIAILNYEGYNMEDAVVINQASVDRGLFRSTHYRPYSAEKLRYPGGQVDEIRIPNKDIQGYTLEENYRLLDDDGLIFPETNVTGADVIIGKTSPPRFLSKLDSFSSVANVRKDTSIRVKSTEEGIVSKVILTESEEGAPLINIVIRDPREPETGDKVGSRHGQKGIIGYIAPTEDIPFTASGIQPDLIFAPFGISRRMTVSHLLESLAGKTGALSGRYVDGTSFESESAEDLKVELAKYGFREEGTETLYDGRTGREYEAKVFVGSIFYMRLKHQVADKIQHRSRGRVALLTRQPTAGKAMEGGLRFGEMEKDTLVGHGASLLMKERFDSDKVEVHVCEKCGDIVIFDSYKSKPKCLICGDKAKIGLIEMSYAFKLFLEELKTAGIRPCLVLKDKYKESKA